MQPGAVTPRLLLTGELDAAQSTVFSAPRTENHSARLKWLAEDGSTVKAGEKIISFDDTAILEKLGELRLAVAEAESNVATTKADAITQLEEKRFAVEQQRVTVDKAKLDADVDPNEVSRVKYGEAQLAVTKAKSEFATAKDDLAAFERTAQHERRVKEIALDTAKRRLEHARKQVTDLELVAPRDGVFIVGRHPWEDRKIQVGDEMWPGFAIAKLPDLSRAVVEARLSDVDHGHLQVGMPVTCVLDAYPSKSWAGSIKAVGPVARTPGPHSTRRFFPVQIDLAESDPSIMLPGLSVQVDIALAKHESDLTVPREAIDTNGEEPKVHHADGRELDVELGPCDAMVCAVTAGLERGDDIVIARGPGS